MVALVGAWGPRAGELHTPLLNDRLDVPKPFLNVRDKNINDAVVLLASTTLATNHCKHQRRLHDAPGTSVAESDLSVTIETWLEQHFRETELFGANIDAAEG